MLTWMGVSWRTASSRRRAGLRDLDALVPDAIAIHTCARDAWLVDGEVGLLYRVLVAHGFSVESGIYWGHAAIERLLTVAVGLDSAVQGEADVGRQVRAALARSGAGIAGVLEHVLARLLRQGRQAGWVREGHGLATLAARAMEDQPRVGVVGSGQIGAQVARALGERAVLYNRSARPGARPLAAMEPAEAWVVATSAPTAWFQPPEPYQRLIDLGHPAQALDDPRRVSLDALLSAADARLPPALVQAAHGAVARAADEVSGRLARRDLDLRVSA